MVFERRGLPSFSQYQLGLELGFVIPPEYKSSYPDARISSDESEWGVHPFSENTSIQHLFQKLSIPLVVSDVPVKSIPTGSLLDFMLEQIMSDRDVMIGFDYASVFNQGKNVNHTGLVSSIRTATEKIKLVDPEEDSPIFVSFRDLLRGLNSLWIISDVLSLGDITLI